MTTPPSIPKASSILTLTKAHLLADHGEADAGVELLTDSLERHPRHPSLEYERATILEQAGRVHDSVEALQRLLVERADDPTLLNALGYTLADHNLELSRAESLIRRALVAMPDNPAVLDSLGWCASGRAIRRRLSQHWSARTTSVMTLRSRLTGRGYLGERRSQPSPQGVGRGVGA